MKTRSIPLYIAITVSVVATLVLTIGAFTGGLLVAPYLNDDAQAAAVSQSTVNTAQPAIQSAQGDVVAEYEQALIDVYRETLPSIVNIQVTTKVQVDSLNHFNFPNPFQKQDPNQGPDAPQDFFNRAGGSGFVWDQEGRIVTNYHVVADATDIEVIFADDTTAKAEVVGGDPDSDLAVIKVDLPASVLKPVKLGDSDALQIGQLSIAIGNPFGQDFTMTSGIISGVGRTIRSGTSSFSIPEVIQTDAPINPGNSGGPLLTRNGEVIGINAQILSNTGASSGIGFAIPINIAKRVVPTLIAGNTYEYPWLGISGNTLTTEAIDFRKLDANTKGAVVLGLAQGGPAEQAGLKGLDETLDPNSDEFRFGGDIITAIDGEPVHDMGDLITYLVETTKPGDVVTLDVIRVDGQQEQVNVTLGVRPSADN